MSDISYEDIVEVEDMVIIAMARDRYRSITLAALVAKLDREYDFRMVGDDLRDALQNLRRDHLVWRDEGGHWLLDLRHLRSRSAPPAPRAQEASFSSAP